jgi:hypothetical protein
MKAVLEFNYPEDEDKLACALHGEKLQHALESIHRTIRAWQKHDGTKPDELIEKIQGIVGDALTMLGE